MKRKYTTTSQNRPEWVNGGDDLPDNAHLNGVNVRYKSVRIQRRRSIGIDEEESSPTEANHSLRHASRRHSTETNGTLSEDDLPSPRSIRSSHRKNSTQSQRSRASSHSSTRSVPPRAPSTSTAPRTLTHVPQHHTDPTLLEFILSLVSTQLYITFRFIIIYICIPLIYMYQIHLVALRKEAAAVESTIRDNVPDPAASLHASTLESLKESQKQPHFIYDYEKHEHVPTENFDDKSSIFHGVEPEDQQQRTFSTEHTVHDPYHTYHYNTDPEQQQNQVRSRRKPPAYTDPSFKYTTRPAQETFQSQALSTLPRTQSFTSKVIHLPQTMLQKIFNLLSPFRIARFIFTKIGYAILAISSYIYLWIIRIKNLILEWIGFLVASIIVLWPFLMKESETEVVEKAINEEESGSDVSLSPERSFWRDRMGDVTVEGTPRRRQPARKSKRGFLLRTCMSALYYLCCFPCICTYRTTRTLLYMSFVVCALAITIGGALAIGIGLSTELIWIPFVTSFMRSYRRRNLGELDDCHFDAIQESVAASVADRASNVLEMVVGKGADRTLRARSEFGGIFSEYWFSTFWFWDFITSLRHVLRFYAYCGIATLMIIAILTCCGSLNSMRIWIGRKRRQLSNMFEDE